MVSVIIPVYNGERHIEACVRSVLAQTNRELEILIVDDGSVDATFSLCKSLAQMDPRIRLFHQKNAGVSAARNAALAEAKGEYILFVDADDLLMPGAVQTLLDGAQTGADFVMGQHALFRGKRSTVWGSSPCTLAFPLTKKAEDIQMLASLVCGQLYRNSILRERDIRFPEDLPYGEDTVFNLRFFQTAKRGLVLETVVYRRRKGGMASALRYYPNRGKIAMALMRAYEAYLPEREILMGVLRNEILDTVSHYRIHCRSRQAKEKTEQFLHCIRSAYPDCGIPQTAKEVMAAAWREKGIQILLRKFRKRIYTIGKRAEI